MPACVPLTPLGAERVAREAAQHSFDASARSVSMDWHLPPEEALEGKEIQRWSERLGWTLVEKREEELRALERGIKPEGPLNAPVLAVIGMDGGRAQMREKNPETKSRWKEDKVMSITSYLPGDGGEKPPVKLVSTYVATMEDAAAFGPMVKLEAYRRGLFQAKVVLNISDAGNWIDPLAQSQGLADVRIIDFWHASERLFAVGAAVWGKKTPEAQALGAALKSLLLAGKAEEVIARLSAELERLGPAKESDGPEHPREILRQNLGYFQRHKEHMHYDEYRRRGWPIGSGNVEAGVKGFNKRIKGTDQFWSEKGVESIMTLRALWMSQDQRWERHWNHRPAYGFAQAA